MSVVSMFLDGSDDYLGIILGNELIVGSRLVRPIEHQVGKTVHMKELSRSQKLQVARHFQELSCKLSENSNLKMICGKRNKVLDWLSSFVEDSKRRT